jgi:GTP cyclohydrolase II
MDRPPTNGYDKRPPRPQPRKPRPSVAHLDGGEGVVTRVYSECLTGDALGSLRCDCRVQLQLGLRAIAAAGRGVLVYASGHEGRGIGFVNKLRSYAEQDRGADTLDVNLALGLAVDAREYTDAAAVLRVLGMRSVRLLTNNPRKVEGLRASDIECATNGPRHVHARRVRRPMEADQPAPAVGSGWTDQRGPVNLAWPSSTLFRP